MTPEEEETTIEDAFERIRAAMASTQTVYVTRSAALRKWSAWVVTHTGGGEPRRGHTIQVQHDRLGAALAELVRQTEAFADRLRGALADGQTMRDATAEQHSAAGAP